MKTDWEKLLQSGGLDVPADFTARLMQRLPATSTAPVWLRPLQIFAGSAAALLGLVELITALLSAWAMSPAF